MSDDEEVTTTQVAALLGVADAHAARSTLRRWGIQPVGREIGRSGEHRYNKAEVLAAIDRRPGQGSRTDLKGPNMNERNWTLTADMTAAQLRVVVADALGNDVIQPQVSGGRFATVTVRGPLSGPPAWMVRVERNYPESQVVIS